jgi:hypothetical protein
MSTKETFEEYIFYFGVSTGPMMTLLISIVFYSAFLTPQKSTLVIINHYGEANLEFFLIPICFIFSLYSTYKIIKGRYP